VLGQSTCPSEETQESPDGRAPGTLASLAEGRKKAQGRNKPLTRTDFETKIKGASAVKLLRPLLIDP
jgi:hypothetical protein